jgi:hypothetical protein
VRAVAIKKKSLELTEIATQKWEKWDAKIMRKHTSPRVIGM